MPPDRAAGVVDRPLDTSVDIKETPADRLRSGLERLDLELGIDRQQRLLGYLELLRRWNAVYNLTSVRDIDDMLSVHLLDSLSIVPLIDRADARTVVDVGSGAGLPAIPIAIARPGLLVHSADAVAKKVAFQISAKAALALSNLHPIHRRIEALRLDSPTDIVVSRAFADLSTMLRNVDHLTGPETTVIAMKGQCPTAELAAVPPNWIVVDTVVIDVPFLGAERCAVILRRARSQG